MKQSSTKTTLVVIALLIATVTGFAKPSVFRAEPDPARARIPVLSWDTEGGSRAQLNLLRPNTSVSLRIKWNGQWRAGDTFETQVDHPKKSETRYRLQLGPESTLEWTIRTNSGRLAFAFQLQGHASTNLSGVDLTFPFSPIATATTVLPSRWDDTGALHLPALISAPDLGQVMLSVNSGRDIKGTLIGSRSGHTVDLTLMLPLSSHSKRCTLEFEPLHLATPRGLDDKSMWLDARRGWFNAFQPSAQWGDQGNQFSAPPGVLANNVVSDPVSCLIHLWADQVLLTPKLSSEVKLTDTLRRTIDWWLDHRTKTNGEVYAYWNHADMLDANASPLIAAWDYVEASGDRKWLARRIDRLEFIADYLVKRDLDGDRLVESTHSGNYGTLIEPMRAGSAYDTINAGHKDAYCNALIYRAWRCLADLEKQLNRRDQQARYTQHANQLKANYVKTFFNPKTGWLAWWQSKDGEIHDLASPLINSLAICYGLVEPQPAREILDRIWNKIEAAGFKRFDLGVPITLVPVRRGDYLIGVNCCGAPQKEDGTDTFGQYLNGGCLVNDAVYFMTALHISGARERGDQILNAMLKRQRDGVFPNGGGFQNGVLDSYPNGAEFYTWDGKTCGYEGHLTYSYSFLQTIFLRESKFRDKVYRPLQ